MTHVAWLTDHWLMMAEHVNPDPILDTSVFSSTMVQYLHVVYDARFASSPAQMKRGIKGWVV